ncbi:amp dependent CoA ligase [Mycena sanguinolenta]|nr:amp dependent CoA ligase [Mycena sanguinolenta]
MTEFSGPPLDPLQIPNDLTIAEFMLEYSHPLRRARGKIPCFIEEATGRQVSLNELRERTLALAQSLSQKYNIGENDVVLICSPNHVDYPVAIWAPQYLGAIFTGVNPNSTPAELVYHIKLTGTTLIIAHSDSFEAAYEAAKLAGIPPDRVLSLDSNPKLLATSVETLISGASVSSAFVPKKLGRGEGKTKIAALCLSSGTTGQPKAVAITHSAIISNTIQLVAQYPTIDTLFCPGDVVLGFLPFFHIAGLVVNLHWMVFCATTIVVVPKFSLVGMLDSVARYGIQHLLLVPPAAIVLCKTPVVKKYDLSKIKYIGCGAAPMTSELQDQLAQLCPQATLGQCYGTTETPAALIMTPISRPFTSGSTGNFLPGVQARVVKGDGTLAGYNEPGELVVKSPSLALGYYKNQQATDEAFTADGWYRTGDEVTVNEQGEVFITGRLKELIKVRAFQVSPPELEGLILNHPDVSDVCVLGIPDDYSGEVPRAYVVLTEVAASKAKLDPEPIKASIAKLVADNKIKYKHLAGGVMFVPLIPKNPSGKILRRVLKAQMMEQTKAKL